MSESSPKADKNVPLYTGRVKFYNRTRMFGFITYDVLRQESKDQRDVFVHSSAIEPLDEHNCANYLKEGEYVEFNIDNSSSKGPVAKAVRGIGNGPLMMDSINKSRSNHRPHTRSAFYAGHPDSKDSRDIVVAGSE